MDTIRYTRSGNRPALMLRIPISLDKSTELMIRIDDKDWIAYYRYEYAVPSMGESFYVYSLMDVTIKGDLEGIE